MLEKHPASTKRVRKDHEACRQVRADGRDQSEYSLRYISTRHGSQGIPSRSASKTSCSRASPATVASTCPPSGRSSARPRSPPLKGQPYTELAFRVMRPFVGDAFDEATFRRLIGEAYASFETPEVAPLKPLGDSGLHLLELFHGPTLAFKDVALQLLGRMLDHTLTVRGQHATIVGATSGDTGSAAIEAVRDRKTIDIFMLFPHGRVSEVQRRQMTHGAGAQRAQHRRRRARSTIARTSPRPASTISPSAIAMR